MTKAEQTAIHKEAKHLKTKKVGGRRPWFHLTWQQLHGLATRIVTGRRG